MSGKGRVENWQELDFLGGVRLAGNVFDYVPDVEDGKCFEEGEYIISSLIVEFSSAFGSAVAKTASGSVYSLGKPADIDLTAKEIFDKVLNN